MADPSGQVVLESRRRASPTARGEAARRSPASAAKKAAWGRFTARMRSSVAASSGWGVAVAELFVAGLGDPLVDRSRRGVGGDQVVADQVGDHRLGDRLESLREPEPQPFRPGHAADRWWRRVGRDDLFDGVRHPVLLVGPGDQESGDPGVLVGRGDQHAAQVAQRARVRVGRAGRGSRRCPGRAGARGRASRSRDARWLPCAVRANSATLNPAAGTTSGERFWRVMRPPGKLVAGDRPGTSGPRAFCTLPAGSLPRTYVRQGGETVRTWLPGWASPVCGSRLRSSVDGKGTVLVIVHPTDGEQPGREGEPSPSRPWTKRRTVPFSATRPMARSRRCCWRCRRRCGGRRLA